MPSDAPQPSDFVLPPSIDEVQFLERLGEGLGSGRFMARLAGIDGPVSLLIEHAPHTERRAFIEWAHRLSRVQHPTVPTLLRVEEVLSPAYVAFDFVPGRTLAQVLEESDPRSPLPPLEALSIALQVASGIRAAHLRGLTHGGIAPRSLVLAPRAGAPDAVRVTGWLPCPEVLDEAKRNADVRAIGSLLHLLLTGSVPPSHHRLDDLMLGWEEARRDLGGLSPIVLALLERPDVHADIDRLIDLIVPAYRSLLDEAYGALEVELTAASAGLDEFDRWQREERALESRLRWVKSWLREHAEVQATSVERAAELRAREARLRTLELEMGMLLERRLPMSTRPPPIAAVPEPDSPHPIPPSANALPSLVPEAIPTAPARNPEREPRRRFTPDAPVVSTRGGSRWARLAAGLGLVAAVGALWRSSLTEDAGYVARPEGRSVLGSATPDAPPAELPARTSEGALSGPPTASTAPAPLVPVAPMPPTQGGGPPPPPGMVYVPRGLLPPGLAPAEAEVVLAQCRLDAPPKVADRLCVPEMLRDEAPAAPIPMAGFFIDQYEVSQARYNACAAKERCPPLGLRWDLPEQPATGVTLRAAEAFCRSQDARLPTVDEWLYAARGTDGRAFPWGNALISEGGEFRANSGGLSNGKRVAGREDGHPYVGGISVFGVRGASPFGVINMAGNVREWTSTESSGSVVVMGGGWKTPGHELRVTRREFLRPSDLASDLGLRCVRDLP